MATPANEVELLQGGISADSPVKGRYVQNLYVRKQAWEVRAGFGQIGQFDSTLRFPPSAIFNDPASFGAQEILGTYALETDFGHLQIVTVLCAMAYTGDHASVGLWQPVYTLQVFDATTRRSWEEVLHRHTSEYNGVTNPMPFWRGCYETCLDADFSAFVSAPDVGHAAPEVSDSHGLFFAEYQDSLFFGNPAMGLWVYLPADVIERSPQTVNGFRNTDFAPVQSESPRCFRISAGNGQFTDAFAYLDAAGYPAPVAAVEFMGVLAIADANNVYFSDAGRPCSIIGINILQINGQTPITAMTECNGQLLIFTEHETFLFQGADSGLLANGKLQKISDSIGCLGPQAITRAENVAVWADRYGVYSSQGLYEIKELSKALKPLFNEQISNPLSAYFQANGLTTLTGPQPKSFYDFEDRRGVNLAYNPLNDLILVSLPSQRIALCLQGGEWSVWNFESHVHNPALTPSTTIAVSQNLQNLHFCAGQQRVFAVGGVETYTPNDRTKTDGVPNPRNDPVRSYYVLEWGVGGALDRSVEVHEDNRQFSGWYESATGAAAPPFAQPVYLLDRPTQLPSGYQFLRTPNYSITDTVPVYLFPLRVKLPDDFGANPSKLSLVFDFDAEQWEPVLVGATPEIDFNLPPERGASLEGWGYNAPGVGHEVRLYDAGTGLPSTTGGQVVCKFDGANGALAWWFKPNINGTMRSETILLSLPFRKKPSKLGDCALSLGIHLVQATVEDGRGPVDADLIWWHEPYIPNRHDNDDVAQPVDWCLKSDQVFNDKPFQVKARGLYMRVLSHGKGTSSVFTTWPWGLVNAVLGVDWKDWTSQILDQTNGAIRLDVKSPALRARFKDSAAAATLTTRTLDNANANPPKWGDSGDTSRGNFLIDDEQFDTLAISDSARGEFFSWTLFGHTRDKAERLILQSVKAAMRQVAGRRRVGR